MRSLVSPLGDARGLAALTLAEAVSASERARIVFGRSVGGELAVWNLLETPHLRIHGATQSGKTGAAIALVAGLLAQAAQVVVLDPRGFKNWRIAADWAELADVRQPHAFVGALAALHAEFVRRDGLLAAEGAKDLAALRGAVRPPRLAVVVDEMGAQRVRAQSAGTLGEVDRYLSVLASEAGAAGVHLLAVDQRPANYHPFVKANLGGVVVFNMPDEGSGRAAGYARAHKLGRYEFYYDGEIYRSIDAVREFDEVVSRSGPVRYPPVLARPVDVEGQRSSVPQAVPARHLPEVERWNAAENVPVEHTEERGEGTVVAALGAEDPGRWDDVVAGWFARNPHALTGPAVGISDLARSMCRDNEAGSDANYEAYKGRAHKLFHEFRAAVRLPGGQPLGTDITL